MSGGILVAGTTSDTGKTVVTAESGAPTAGPELLASSSAGEREEWWCEVAPA